MRIDDPTLTDDVTKSLRILNSLAKILKQGRIEKGYVLQVDVLLCMIIIVWNVLECVCCLYCLY